MAGRLICKKKNGDTAIQIFRSNRDRSKGRSKREKSKVGTEKQPNRQRSTGINSGGEYPNVAVIIYKRQDKAERDK